MRKVLAAITIFILGLSMIDVAISQSPGDQKPQTTLMLAQPSANPSPVAVDKYDSPRTDGEGHQWVRHFGTMAASIASTVNVALVSPSPFLTADLDSGAGTQTGAMVGIAVPASGGAVAVGGTANGIKVSPTHTDGTTLSGGYGIKVQGYSPHDDPWAAEPPILAGGYAHATGSLPTAVSGDGDAARLLVDRYGRARVVLDATSNGASLSDNLGLYVQSVVPHDVALSANPNLTGFASQDTLPAAVGADGRMVRAAATRQGQLRTITDDNANAVGHSVKYEASHAGGSSEVTAKASAGVLKWIRVANPNTTDVFLQLHDASNPTIGSATPLDSICIPGGTGASNRGIMNQEFGPVGITFSTALTYTVTTTAEGSTAPSSAVTVSIGYK